jgi:hypothetical protein
MFTVETAQSGLSMQPQEQKFSVVSDYFFLAGFAADLVVVFTEAFAEAFAAGLAADFAGAQVEPLELLETRGNCARHHAPRPPVRA